MKSFTISLGQMQCDLEDMGKNARKIAEWLRRAADCGSSVLVLPELSLTGYQSFQGWDAAALSDRIRDTLADLSGVGAETGVGLLVGYPEITDAGVYIVSSYIERGAVVAAHRKTNLCNYLHYTEHLHFIAGDEVTCAAADVANIGIVVCEDSWHAMNAIVATQLGAEIIVNPAAASVTDGWDPADCLENWKRMSVGTAFLQTSYFVLCNQAGPTADGKYMGGSHVVDPTGRMVGEPLSTEETMIHVPLDGDLLAELRARRPLIANERMEIYGKYCNPRR